MGCSTTMLGIIIGFFVANFPGAIFGGLLGYVMENKLGNKTRTGGKGYYSNNSRQGIKREAVLKNLFALLAKYSQADGQVTRAEIRIIDEFIEKKLHLTGRDRKMAINYFDEAKRSGKSFSFYAEKFAGLINYDQNLLSQLLELLQRIGKAEGKMSSEQQELIDRAKKIFRVSRRNYAAQSKDKELREAYRTLDLDPEVNLKKVKKRYREMAKKYHPDRAIAEDMPEEFVEMAKEKFSEIKDAYELIMEIEGN
ncbi:TerB family tellurite resistance protein [Halarsenatibacter silvermanii]|uniref:DnaJ like chaperone protein n=1 Tax=Halarsenatibacter silvermanii TaxID=321763 RepID=A0A1G9SNQ9_9FIRM|nr:TerB family tellurite resistance protein [Halarsenatibacter silvermanii]SDM36997.1 DnaJ like chaperone protein [Halarsenatibacter silvermanii]